MQDFSLRRNMNINEFPNKNIWIPNFNYNYNFNLGQTKPLIDQGKIDLYNNSMTISDKLKNAYPNNTINSAEIYNAYNSSLNSLKLGAKSLSLEDMTKRAHFYFSLYNLINNEKCHQIDKEEYKCSFSDINFPNQPNNKKIQININNNLYNENFMNNNIYARNNKDIFMNNNINNQLFGIPYFKNNNNNINSDNNINITSNICLSDTESISNNDNNDNDFIGKKRNLENDENDEKDDKYKFNNIDLNKKENPLIKKNIKKMKKSQNKENNTNTGIINKENNEENKLKNKAKISPTIEIQNIDKKMKKKNNKKNKSIKERKVLQEKEGSNNNSFNSDNNNDINNDKKEYDEYINFDNDLKDYLRRTISENRQYTFFSNIIPQSLSFITSLFKKDNNIQTNKRYPIYRNKKFELSLLIEPGGKIKKQLTKINC